MFLSSTSCYNSLQPVVFNRCSDPWRILDHNPNTVEQVGESVEFYGGELDGVSFTDQDTVKKYARPAHTMVWKDTARIKMHAQHSHGRGAGLQQRRAREGVG